MAQPGTPNLMRELNERSLLSALQKSGPATRPHLAKLTGLSKPTVSGAMANLEQAGLVLQIGQSGGSRGPAATVYAENEKAGLILAIDLSQGGVHGALADLAGNVLQRSDQSGPLRNYNALLAALDRATDRLREAVPTGLDIVQTVVAISGVYDHRRNELRFAALTPGGSGGNLLSELQRRYGPALLIENDANLAAIGEHDAGNAQGIDDFVFLMVDAGLGMGVLLNGQLHRGAHGSAGEIAYLPIGQPPRVGKAPAARPPRPDSERKGPAEQAISDEAILTIAREAGLTEAKQTSDVIDAARTGNVAALRAVQEVANHLAKAIAATCAVLDPQRVILGGALGRNFDVLRKPLQRSLALVTPLEIELVATALGDDAVLRGAIAIAQAPARASLFELRSVP
jgi:predicted NBD/HSP70 family sugar kinase